MKLFAIIYIAVCASFFSSAAMSSELTTKDYARLTNITNMSLSPSGDLIVFRLRSEKSPNSLGIYSLKEGKYLNVLV
ncbi:MAG: hypothetical protein ACI93R_002882 [Flavobacteriales bacterium]|jgi:hypothetical protein